MKRVRQRKSAAKKQWRRNQDTREHLRWRALQQYLTILLINIVKLSIVDVCRGPCYNSGNSAT